MKNLKWAIEYAQTQSQTQQELTILDEAGLIRFFEFTNEQACKTLQGCLQAEGLREGEGTGARAAFRVAIHHGIIEDGEG